jgi:hypothetical protein
MGIGISFETWAVDNTNDFPMRVTAEKGGTRRPGSAGPAFSYFQVLSNEIPTPKELICPADRRRLAAKDFGKLSKTNLSYFVALDAQQDNPLMLLAGDRNLTNGGPVASDRVLVLTTNAQVGWTHELHNCQGNVVLADASVQRVSSSHLRSWLAASGVTNRLVMP